MVDPIDAQAALDGGSADLVEMTRAQIADPRLVALVRAGTPAQVRPCILCNQACHVRDNRNPIVSCVGEPGSGHEVDEPPSEGTDPLSRTSWWSGADPPASSAPGSWPSAGTRSSWPNARHGSVARPRGAAVEQDGASGPADRLARV